MPNFSVAVPTCLKAICVTCRNKNWISSSPSFSATGRLKRMTLIQRHRDLSSIERRPAGHPITAGIRREITLPASGWAQQEARFERFASITRRCIDQAARTRRCPAAAASHGPFIEDVRTVLAKNNSNTPVGSISGIEARQNTTLEASAAMNTAMSSSPNGSEGTPAPGAL
jgi:hypothetical protein